MKHADKITKNNSHKCVKIYINNLLHLAFPKDDNMKLQSWLEDEGKERWYKIEITSCGVTDYSAYDNYDMWKKILELLDEEF